MPPNDASDNAFDNTADDATGNGADDANEAAHDTTDNCRQRRSPGMHNVGPIWTDRSHVSMTANISPNRI